MIDLHSHILPGLDDGAAELDDALAMARLAVADGIDTLVATPHANVDLPRADVRSQVDALQSALDRREIALRILPGAEIALSPEVPALLAARVLPTVAESRYALVELPFRVVPPHVDRVLFEMQLAGFTPVMAHVERYRFVHGALELLDEWCDRGVVLQVTAGSLRGDFGPHPRETAEAIVRRAWPAVLASDCHDTRRRRPELAFASGLVVALADEARAAELIETGPAAIVADQPFPTPRVRPASSSDASTPRARIGDLFRRLRDR